jgi:selenocysteine lyase/cysteine desulfurase
LRRQLQETYHALHQREGRQCARLWHGLGEIDGVKRYGPAPTTRRTPTIAFTVGGRRPAEVARQLADAACFVSDGDFYASTAVERLGQQPDGVVRIGVACYTTDEEVERVLTAVAAASG